MSGNSMTDVQRITIGGAGALIPLLLNLVVVDFEAMIVNLTLIVAMGWVAKGLVLFLLGGGVAWLHQDEKRKRQLFELGILAPAMLLSVANAGQIKSGVTVASLPNATALDLLATPAYAQTVTCESPSEFSLPDETIGEEFVRGITGSAPARIWFVIVSAHSTCLEAQAAADWVRSRHTDLAPQVYRPSGGYGHHAVVIGSNLRAEDASSLRDHAIADGLVGTHLWRLGAN